eukprot:6476258-Amphidinium_carterae.1
MVVAEFCIAFDRALPVTADDLFLKSTYTELHTIMQAVRCLTDAESSSQFASKLETVMATSVDGISLKVAQTIET